MRASNPSSHPKTLSRDTTLSTTPPPEDTTPTTVRTRPAPDVVRSDALVDRKRYERIPLAIAGSMGGMVGALATVTMLNAVGLSGGAFWGSFALAMITLAGIVGFVITRPRT